MRRCIALLVALTGCPDPQGELDEFVVGYCDIEEHRQTQSLCGGTPAGVEACEPAVPGELDGEYLLALTPTQSPTKPAPFRATVATTGNAFDVSILLTLMPLDANDRMTALPPALGPYGPFPITAAGTFTAELGTLTIPSGSNPVGDFALTADVVLEGRACAGAMSLCGVARGAITDPLMLSLDGTTWGMVSIAEPAIINCAGDEAAPL
ncbi:MAG TPA: hypothetical protein VFB62_25270 [Polyangiaceae bacterium]|nr:hypothetical protein [Polyangiaceae bacterium]